MFPGSSETFSGLNIIKVKGTLVWQWLECDAACWNIKCTLLWSKHATRRFKGQRQSCCRAERKRLVCLPFCARVVVSKNLTVRSWMERTAAWAFLCHSSSSFLRLSTRRGPRRSVSKEIWRGSNRQCSHPLQRWCKEKFTLSATLSVVTVLTLFYVLFVCLMSNFTSESVSC